MFCFSTNSHILITTTVIICIVGFSFQSFCLWFLPLSTTFWGVKSGHLLIYDCPASINLRDLSSPRFVQSQWDYWSMSTALLIEGWRPLEAMCSFPLRFFLSLFQRSQWICNLLLVDYSLSPSSLHVYQVTHRGSRGWGMVRIFHFRCALCWVGRMLWLPWSYTDFHSDFCLIPKAGYKPINLLCDIFDNIPIHSLFKFTRFMLSCHQERT